MTTSVPGVDRSPLFQWDARVPEYDAFGREIGENTLAGLGDDSGATKPAPQAESAAPAPTPAASDGWTEAAPPRPEPEAAPAQVTFSLPEGAPVTVMPGGRRRRAGGLGCLVGLVILAAVVAGPVIAIVSIVGSASDVIDDVTDAIDPDTLDLPGVADPPTGITGRSLIAEDNLAAALRRIEQAGFAKAERVTVWPDRLGADTVKGGKGRSIQIRHDGEVTRGDPSRKNAPFGTIRLASLDPAAPARLVRGSAERYRVKPKGIGYVIASAGPEPGNLQWRAYFKNGIYVEGDAKGRVIRRFDGG
jgi:hypothetical protein